MHRESDNSLCSTWRSGPTIIKSIYYYTKKEKNLKKNQIKNNCGNVTNIIEETLLQNYLKNFVQVYLGQNLLKTQRWSQQIFILI